MDQNLYDKMYQEYELKAKQREDDRVEANKKWKLITETAAAKGTRTPLSISIIELANNTIR